jgi:ubiquinone biosynthesis protein
MGPIFIKLGQFLSTRRDLFSSQLIDSMLNLQDNVELDSHDYFQPIFNQLLDQYQISIDAHPIAAASIAHVYFGVLRNGHPVAVKIQRPDLRKKVSQDLRIMSIAAWIFACIMPKRLKIYSIFQRFKNTLWNEIDFQREAAQADALKVAMQDYTHHIVIPKIYWQYSSQSVLVMDRAEGKRFNLIIYTEADDALKKKMAKKLYSIFLHSVFQHGIFHGDMHPGNIFFDTERNTFTFVDFGIVCRLEPVAHKFISRQIYYLFRRYWRSK